MPIGRHEKRNARHDWLDAIANSDANIAWFQKCLAACTDDDCQKRCAEHAKKMPSRSIDELQNLVTCMQNDCSEACR